MKVILIFECQFHLHVICIIQIIAVFVLPIVGPIRYDWMQTILIVSYCKCIQSR